MIIESILTKGSDVITTSFDTSLEVAACLLHEHMTSILVVCSDEGKVIGVLSERDLVRGIAKEIGTLKDMNVADLMTADPHTCSLDTDPIDVLNTMQEGGFRHMPVVKDGILVGFVTKGAITQFMLMT